MEGWRGDGGSRGGGEAVLPLLGDCDTVVKEADGWVAEEGVARLKVKLRLRSDEGATHCVWGRGGNAVVIEVQALEVLGIG